MLARYHLPLIRDYATFMKTIPQALKFECSDPAKFRLKVLNHAKEYGWKSARDAYRVQRSTIFLWKKKFKDSGGKLLSLVGLGDGSQLASRLIKIKISLHYIDILFSSFTFSSRNILTSDWYGTSFLFAIILSDSRSD